MNDKLNTTMRKINRIFIHCTGSQKGATVDSILRTFKVLGWKNPGYHYLIDAEGKVIQLLSHDKIANGVKGYNANSIHIAYIGGIDKTGRQYDSRTDAQKKAIITTLQNLRRLYPSAVILGHRDISPDTNRNGIVEQCEYIKGCPLFNAKEEYANI